jgi:hypothetical protein
LLFHGGLDLIWLLDGIFADAAQLVSHVVLAVDPLSVYVERGSIAKTALQTMRVDMVVGVPQPLVIQL